MTYNFKDILKAASKSQPLTKEQWVDLLSTNWHIHPTTREHLSDYFLRVWEVSKLRDNLIVDGKMNHGGEIYNAFFLDSPAFIRKQVEICEENGTRPLLAFSFRRHEEAGNFVVIKFWYAAKAHNADN